MQLRKNLQTRKTRLFWRNLRKSGRRTEKWPAWKKDIQIARHITLLK
jgi:hypothetical protein